MWCISSVVNGAERPRSSDAGGAFGWSVVVGVDEFGGAVVAGADGGCRPGAFGEVAVPDVGRGAWAGAFGESVATDLDVSGAVVVAVAVVVIVVAALDGP